MRVKSKFTEQLSTNFNENPLKHFTSNGIITIQSNPGNADFSSISGVLPVTRAQLFLTNFVWKSFSAEYENLLIILCIHMILPIRANVIILLSGLITL